MFPSCRLGPFAVVLAVAAGLALEAQAAEPSVWGATPLDQGQWGVWGTLGAPDVEGGARFGLSSVADVGARLRLSGGTGATMGGFGVTMSGLTRLRLARLGDWEVALQAEPGLNIHGSAQHWAPLVKAKADKAANLVALDLGLPAVTASTWLTPSLLLAVGLAAPLRVYVLPEATLEVPVLLQVATEAKVSGHWSALAGGELGGNFYGPGAGAATADWSWRLRLGLGWR